MDARTPNRQLGKIPDNYSCPLKYQFCTPPPMVTSLLYRRKAIFRPMKDGDGKRKFVLGLIVTMVFKCQKQNQPNPLRKDSPVPSVPREQTLWQPTPGPSGTQLLEDSFR
ncbi:hypothetical protein O181_125447, partial [Austropuccinia psidii MF-1]|nr:hypothetical protein [Austropuccinia psidii MF-1]